MPIFGHNAVAGDESEQCQNIINGSVFTCPDAGEAQSITAYVQVVGAGNRDIKCAIYRHDTLALVPNGGTDVWNTNTWGPGWHTFNFSAPKPILAAMDYILVMWSAPQPTYSGLYWDPGNGPDPGQQGHRDDRVFGAWPDPIVIDSHNTRKYCIYATYNLLGWSGKISGVTDPAEIQGVAKADIAEVKGVA